MKKLSLLLALFGIWNYSLGQSSYFPLKKGTTMTYAYGKELYQGQNVDISQLRMTVKILEETKVINGNEYFISETSAGTPMPATKAFLRVNDQGAIVGIEDGATEESVMIKQPLEVGDSWTTSKGGMTSTSEVVALNGSIETPAETFTNCLVVASSENGTQTKAYFKEDVGMVAIQVVMGGSEKLFVYLIDRT